MLDVSSVTHRGADQWASASADGKTSGASGRTVTGCGAGVLGRTEIQISFSAGINVEIAVIRADGQENDQRAQEKTRPQCPFSLSSFSDEAGDTLKQSWAN